VLQSGGPCHQSGPAQLPHTLGLWALITQQREQQTTLLEGVADLDVMDIKTNMQGLVCHVWIGKPVMGLLPTLMCSIVMLLLNEVVPELNWQAHFMSLTATSHENVKMHLVFSFLLFAFPLTPRGKMKWCLWESTIKISRED
jgi:hypothetical protein